VILKPQGKSMLNIIHTWQDNINMCLRDVGCKNVASVGSRWGPMVKWHAFVNILIAFTVESNS
jgi:hypothetical protein